MHRVTRSRCTQGTVNSILQQNRYLLEAVVQMLISWPLRHSYQNSLLLQSIPTLRTLLSYALMRLASFVQLAWDCWTPVTAWRLCLLSACLFLGRIVLVSLFCQLLDRIHTIVTKLFGRAP